MGQELVKLFEQKQISWSGFNSTYPLTKDKLKSHSVLIDFSSPSGFSQALQYCIELGVPFVSGTTGLSSEQKESLTKAGEQIPVLWSANMSLGIALLKKALKLFAGLESQDGFTEDFDFQVEEFHHRQKKDRPSGTALELQKSIQNVMPHRQLPTPMVMRAGAIYGTHRVYAVSSGEMICFEHQVLDRRIFAEGALRAAAWLIGKKSGNYCMEDFLEGHFKA